MKKYAKINNEQTKSVDVGVGTNTDFYKSIGMELLDVEQAYNGTWYVQGYAPTQSDDELALQESEKELSETETQINDIKDRLLYAILLDDTETVEQLKSEYKELVNE